MALAEKRPPRVSAHRRHGPTALPSASTGTVEPHCPVIPTPTSSLTSTRGDASVAPTPALISRHHSSGSWTAPPPGRYVVVTADSEHARTLPRSEIAPVFGPPVPRSTARIQGSATPVRGCDLIHRVERCR